MPGIIEHVDKVTQNAGENRFQMLMFGLTDQQAYGINVFKVREVLPCPALTKIPSAPRAVRGLANLRDETLMIIDLSEATGLTPIAEPTTAIVIIVEYNRSTHGFLVASVDRIVNTSWSDIKPPPGGMDQESYLTATTRVKNATGEGEQIVQVLDVEQVLSEVLPHHLQSEDSVTSTEPFTGQRVLIVDDSRIARKQVCALMDEIGIAYDVVNDGVKAYEALVHLRDTGVNVAEHYLMLLADIEMPQMDGYALTSHIKSDPSLKDLCVVLHSSLTGDFNEHMVQKVAADGFVSKFSKDDIYQVIMDKCKMRSS